MLWPNQPEYLQMFSNVGPITVKIKFSDKSASMSERKMTWQELDCLMDQETKSPYSHIYFDTHRFSILRYEIDLVKNLLTIIAGSPEPQ